MKTGKEASAAFNNDKFTALSLLMKWSVEELREMKTRYDFDYKYSEARFLQYRIDLLEEAIICKRGNEEQAWDYLT